VLGDERDLLRLRSNFRKEEVFVYPTNFNKKDIRKFFEVIVERINSIADKPQFYNTISHSCMSSLTKDFSKVLEVRDPFNYRWLLNGYSAELMFEHGAINSIGNFADTKRFHHINQYVQADNNGEGYSMKIRPHINNKTDQDIDSQ